MSAILAAILAVLPDIISAITAIVTAVNGGQPVAPAHAQLKAALDKLHDEVVKATP